MGVEQELTMKRIIPLVSLCLSGSLQAAVPGEKAQDTGTMVTDAITQPFADVNLKKRGIPPELLAIREDPYSLEGIRNCRQVIAAVKSLDAALGPDFDQIVVEDKGQKRVQSAKAIAGGFISSLIPFRALIREVTGANKTDDEYREAIYAGVVRRGFLKGYGQHRRCRAPGRPLNDVEQLKQAEAIDPQPQEQSDATDKR
jgi:hypothetical protein